MAITSCRSLLGTGLSSPCAIDFVGRPGRVVKNIGSKRLHDGRQNCVMYYTKDEAPSDNVDKNVSKQDVKLSWLEGVSSAGVGAVLGIGIGVVSFALPAFANFLSYDHADLRGRDMSGQDLHGAVFAGMTFTFVSDRKINLKGSNLDGSTDTFAGFEGANLQDSSWVRAFADRVVVRDANLENAIFTDAVLSGSQFDGADITGADFTDALIDNFQRLKMCKKAKGTNPSTGVETRGSLFC